VNSPSRYANELEYERVLALALARLLVDEYLRRHATKPEAAESGAFPKAATSIANTEVVDDGPVE
jgi:hypothetical protein